MSKVLRFFNYLFFIFNFSIYHLKLLIYIKINHKHKRQGTYAVKKNGDEGAFQRDV